MSGEEQPESTYREILQDTREAIEVAQELMKSEDDRSKIIGLNLFLDLSEQAIIIAEALRGDQERDFNPLARRFRERRGEETVEPAKSL